MRRETVGGITPCRLLSRWGELHKQKQSRRAEWRKLSRPFNAACRVADGYKPVCGDSMFSSLLLTHPEYVVFGALGFIGGAWSMLEYMANRTIRRVSGRSR
jgi:hypothetical protein